MTETKLNEWVQSGSVIEQTERYDFSTGGVDLKLTRLANRSWALRCDQLWSGGALVAIAPSDVQAPEAQHLAIVAAHNRMSELIRALPLGRRG